MTTGPDVPRGSLVGRFTLPTVTHAPRQARGRLTALLQDLGMDAELVTIAVLLTSELVTNAVLHGRGEPTVEVRASDGHVWVGIQDPDSRLPYTQPTDSGALGGRGLQIVDALAHTWGTTPITGDGKSVWFTLPRQPEL